MSARINAMSVREWTNKLASTQKDLEKFAHILNIDYWGTIKQAGEFGHALTAQQEMGQKIANVFNSITNTKHIAEDIQFEMLKLLFPKLPREDGYGRTTNYKIEGIENLKKNGRIEIANKFEEFCKLYKNDYVNFPSETQLREIIYNHNKIFHPELLTNIEKSTPQDQQVHAAIKSKKSTLISSQNIDEPLKGEFHILKENTEKYVKFVNIGAELLHNLYEKDTEITELKSKLNSNVTKIKQAKDVEMLSPILLESAQLAKKMIELCEKHDPNTAKQFSKENMSLLSKIVDIFKSFITNVQTHLTSKKTLEKRKSDVIKKNTQRKSSKQIAESTLKNLERLLTEISTTPTLKKGS